MNSDFEKKVEQYYDEIVSYKPEYIKTDSSFERKCVYTALERINNDLNLGIKCNRKKVWIQKRAENDMCKKHLKNLWGICDCCSDPFCIGPFCDYCDGECAFGVYKGELLWKTKVVSGINLYYENCNMRPKKLIT